MVLNHTGSTKMLFQSCAQLQRRTSMKRSWNSLFPNILRLPPGSLPNCPEWHVKTAIPIYKRFMKKGICKNGNEEWHIMKKGKVPAAKTHSTIAERP